MNSPANTDKEPKSVTLGFRVTEAEATKIKRLAAMRDTPYADLLREHSVNALLKEHDRIMEMAGSESPAS